MPVLHSKRAHLYVLERARVHRRGGGVEYASEDGRGPRSFNVPSANTSFLLLGPGSSITDAAARLLADDGVLVGFCGGGGTPLLSAQPSPAMFEPADEYRDPAHLHAWIETWSDPARRLAAAKSLLRERKAMLEGAWDRLDGPGPWPDLPLSRLRDFGKAVSASRDQVALLSAEAVLTKALYANAATSAGMAAFTRVHGKSRGRPRKPRPEAATDANALLDHGNYLAYGMAAVVLWVLGIPASLSVLHGKTRRGGLVFDLADVVKDSVVLPLAFNVASRAADAGLSHSDFRSDLLDAFEREGAMQAMFEAMAKATIP